ncbi:MAG: hypothetical protein V4574_18015 [Pseudomonadota bacterium]
MGWIARGMMLAALAFAAPAQADDAADLAALVRANSWPVAAGEAGLSGPGAGRILDWSSGAQFFLLGENHGNAGMARFATALSRSLAGQGYRYTAVETDPLVTGIMTGRLRSGGKPALAAWLAADQRNRAIPFYSWSEEADFITASLARGPVWGLDQSFIAAAHVHLDAIAAASRSPAVRALAGTLAAEARKDVMGFLGHVDVARLKALRLAMPRNENAAAVTLADQLIESAEIYGPFTGGTGSYYLANLRRETLMKTLFIANYRAALRRDGAPPRVLLKMGSNHLARGLSPTHMPSLGSFLAENALGMLGKPVFNLRMICGPGTQQTLFDFTTYDCAGDEFAPVAAAFKPFLQATGDTLIDLRPLRDRPGLWKDWPQDAKDIVWSYDALVVVGASGGSHFLAPLPPKPQ